MMRQYQEMISLVDIEIREEDQKACKRYVNSMYALKVFYFFCTAFFIFFIFMNKENNSFFTNYLILFLLVLILYLYYSNKKRFLKKYKRMLQNQCDPVHFISFCGAMFAYAKREKSWEQHFYNIGMAFCYAGRIEDAKKIVSLMDKYIITEQCLFWRRILSSEINYFEKNLEELQRDCEILTSVSKGMKLDKKMKFFLNTALSKFTFLNLEQQGRYQEMYDMYQSSYSYYHSMLVDVKKNYYMCQAARWMEEYELAEAHRRFVLENGGTLWYKTVLENENETERLDENVYRSEYTDYEP